ncbi:MAG: methyltransferase domain-containing protein [Bacteroidia bacterium]
MKKYVQYGCGHSAPKEWVNFDVSPTLRIQKTPIIGLLVKKKLNTTFPSNVLYGDIIKGLPIEDNTCDGLYCSHTLEHLALDEFRIALKNSYRILKKGGVFRCIVPDLEHIAREYITSLEKGDDLASVKFVSETLLGSESRQKGIKNFISSFYGNSKHLWMWDSNSMTAELKNAGFSKIRNCVFNDSSDPMFALVENKSRFVNSVAIECVK